MPDANEVEHAAWPPTPWFSPLCRTGFPHGRINHHHKIADRCECPCHDPANYGPWWFEARPTEARLMGDSNGR